MLTIQKWLRVFTPEFLQSFGNLYLPGPYRCCTPYRGAWYHLNNVHPAFQPHDILIRPRCGPHRCSNASLFWTVAMLTWIYHSYYYHYYKSVSHLLRSYILFPFRLVPFFLLFGALHSSFFSVSLWASLTTSRKRVRSLFSPSGRKFAE